MIQVFDKPMCCATGICGPEVDPMLVQFAADLDAIKDLGCTVVRFNLAQQPQAFIENKSVHQLLSTEGTDCLPIVLLDDSIVSRGVYPQHSDFVEWIHGVNGPRVLSVSQPKGGCCGSDGCC